MIVTWALARAEPPGPVAVTVYVVDCEGLTVAEPCAATWPTEGSKVMEVAFVDDHVSVTC